jgi:transcriptional regulator of acetoin/glycerol metabolism
VSWLSAFSRAREEFLSSSVRRLPDGAGLIRPTVYESWRRSRLQGLRPDVVEPRYLSELDFDSYLSRAVAPIVTRRETALEQGAYALVLTDREGRLLRRWVKEPGLGAAMDALGIAAGSAMDESTVGTTALVALLTGAPEMIRGPEHFSEKFRDFTCASAPIIHPINRRLLGSVSLVCRLRDTAPIMLPWVTEIVAAVEDGLRLRAAQREQQLFDAYTTYNRDARHPVVALDSTTIITNAAAARMLGGVDQSLLWEHARRSLVDRADDPSTLTLPNGQVLTIECRAVSNEGDDAGAVLVIKKQTTEPGGTAPVIAAAAQLPRLVGRSERWRALCRQAGGLIGTGVPVLVTGEPGTGRLAVARALQDWHDVSVIDAADAFSREPERWCRELASHLDRSTDCLVIRHADLLSPSLALATLATLRRGAPVRVLATAEKAATDPSTDNAFLESLTAVLEVPPLRDRLDDLPELLASLTAQATDGSSGVEWTREAVQTLSRLEWPRNVSSLDALVRRLMVDRAGVRRIGVEHLPPEYRARGSRRPLASLEQTEAHAILSALRAAGGNKNQAAQSLGIARSTLYRKLRALGLDLSSTVY